MKVKVLLATTLFAISHSLLAETPNPKERVENYTNTVLIPEINKMNHVIKELKSANIEKADWLEFTNKKLTDDELAKAKSEGPKSYDGAESLWSANHRKFIKEHFKSPGGREVKSLLESAHGAIGEIFITDKNGGNVIQSDKTSDHFQGDEAKFKNVANKSLIFIGPLEKDESTRLTGTQVSIPIWDNEEFIGVAVVLVIPDKIAPHK